MYVGRHSVQLGLILASLVGNGAGATAAGTEPGYSTYTSWRDWARVQPGVRAGLASSYDRAGGNSDYSQYEDPLGLIYDPIPCTVKTLTGPGVVWRFWMPHHTSNQVFPVRFFFDDELTPRIDTTSNVWLYGVYAYFQAPLVNTFAGGQTSYEPIPFAHALRIETVNKQLPPNNSWTSNRHYYQYAYSLYPSGTALTSYTGVLTPAQQTERNAVVNLFEQAGQHPAGGDPNAIRLLTPAQAVNPGQCVALMDRPGPGLIRQVSVRMPAAPDSDLAGLRLRVRYDANPDPAIDVAVGDFFGAGRGRVLYNSLPLGTDSTDGFYCYWPMPFRQSVIVQLCNTSEAPITIDGAVVEYEAGPLDADLCYLHAVAQTSVRTAGQTYHPMLSASGRGHYVGNLLYLEQDVNDFYMLEGDDVITVDGADTLYGTGLEDAYNGGYYYNWAVPRLDEPEGALPPAAIRPLSGILFVTRQSSPALARADQYRWRIADRVPFRTFIDVKIECSYGTVGSRWTSVAFWYQAPLWPGDVNCDGVRSFADINPFVLAVSDEAGYRAQYPDCDWLNADCNGDGVVSYADINPFVALLAH